MESVADIGGEPPAEIVTGSGVIAPTVPVGGAGTVPEAVPGAAAEDGAGGLEGEGGAGTLAADGGAGSGAGTLAADGGAGSGAGAGCEGCSPTAPAEALGGVAPSPEERVTAGIAGSAAADWASA